jgi:hypothetical protein
MCGNIIEIFGKEVFEELNNIFELASIDEKEDFFLREVRRKIIEKFDQVVCSLDNLINPDSTYIQMFDAHSLTDSDRNVITSIIIKFGEIIKMHKLLEFETHKDSDKDFCVLALNVYKDNIGSVSDIFTKIKLAYKNLHKTKIDINYLG